jgi:hypothetical protein
MQKSYNCCNSNSEVYDWISSNNEITNPTDNNNDNNEIIIAIDNNNENNEGTNPIDI